jgi:hypothetical protein
LIRRRVSLIILNTHSRTTTGSSILVAVLGRACGEQWNVPDGWGRCCPVRFSAAALTAIGYLASGFLIVAACEAGYDGRWLISREWTPERIGFYSGISYAIGSLIALLAERIIERRFVGQFLAFPEDRLLTSRADGSRCWRELVFRTYYRPIPVDLQNRIATRALHDQVPECGRELFVHASAVVGDDRALFNRLQASLELSRLCRTMCLGLMIVAAILASGIIGHGFSSRWGQAEWRKFGYCAWALSESTFMLFRYLKFLRQHALLVLTRYSGLPLS